MRQLSSWQQFFLHPFCAYFLLFCACRIIRDICGIPDLYQIFLLSWAILGFLKNEAIEIPDTCYSIFQIALSEQVSENIRMNAKTILEFFGQRINVDNMLQFATVTFPEIPEIVFKMYMKLKNQIFFPKFQIWTRLFINGILVTTTFTMEILLF